MAFILYRYLLTIAECSTTQNKKEWIFLAILRRATLSNWNDLLAYLHWNSISEITDLILAQTAVISRIGKYAKALSNQESPPVYEPICQSIYVKLHFFLNQSVFIIITQDSINIKKWLCNWSIKVERSQDDDKKILQIRNISYKKYLWKPLTAGKDFKNHYKP